MRNDRILSHAKTADTFMFKINSDTQRQKHPLFINLLSKEGAFHLYGSIQKGTEKNPEYPEWDSNPQPKRYGFQPHSGDRSE